MQSDGRKHCQSRRVTMRVEQAQPVRLRSANGQRWEGTEGWADGFHSRLDLHNKREQRTVID